MPGRRREQVAVGETSRDRHRPPRHQPASGGEHPLSVTLLRGPLLLAALTALPLALWATAGPLDERFTGAFASLESLAVGSALAGTAAFALNLLLGARLPRADGLFGGLDRLYKVHRANGQIAFLLLLGHVVLILSSRATVSVGTALDLLGTGAGLTVFAGVLAFSAMTVAILLTLFVRLGHEVFVYVQRAFGFVFLLASYHVFTTDGVKAESLALNVYMAALAALAVAAFTYRSLFGNLLVRRRPYRVEAVNRLDEFVTEIVMRPLAKPLRFTPGQVVYVNFRALAERFHPFEASVSGQVFSIRAGELGNQFHPFSITAASDEATLRITAKAVGDYTRAMRTLEAGTQAVVEGPYGSFSHRNVANPTQIWIAGGIGITPFLSMSRSLREEDEPVIDLYYCVEHAEEAHFLEELRAIAARRADFRVHLVPRDEAGFLTAERLAAERGDLAYQDVLICGPPAMIESLRAQLVARGVPPERIHSEEFGFAKLGRKVEGAVPPADDQPATAPLAPRRRAAGPVLLAVSTLAALTFFAGFLLGRSTDDGSAAERGPAATVAGSAAAGEAVFASAGCGSCHALEAAGTSGGAGPDLDDAQPAEAAVRRVVAEGQGAMPAFADELSEQQIADVAAFVAEAAGG